MSTPLTVHERKVASYVELFPTAAHYEWVVTTADKYKAAVLHGGRPTLSVEHSDGQTMTRLYLVGRHDLEVSI